MSISNDPDVNVSVTDRHLYKRISFCIQKANDIEEKSQKKFLKGRSK